jgi:predicted GNAT family acetyltransferase
MPAASNYQMAVLMMPLQEPFVLSRNEAYDEAVRYINSQQMWVHEISRCGGPPAIASIVAVTRASDKVAAITKVFTNPAWRSRRCAERLVRHVCAQ